MSDIGISELAGFMTEFWKLIKKYYEPEDTDEYWQGFMRDANSIVKGELSKKLLLAFADYLEGKRHDKQ